MFPSQFSEFLRLVRVQQQVPGLCSQVKQIILLFSPSFIYLLLSLALN